MPPQEQSFADTLFDYTDTSNLVNNWKTGIDYIISNYNHDLPRLIQIDMATLSKGNNQASQYWWLFVHFDALLLAPTQKNER